MEIYQLSGCQLSEYFRRCLDIRLGKILNYNPSFEFRKAERKGTFIFSNRVKRRKSFFNNISFDFNFELYHEEDGSINDYIVINALWIMPRGRGIGTELMKSFICEAEKLNSIKHIYLFPKDRYARKFWTKLGFKEFCNDDKSIAPEGKLMKLRIDTWK